MFDLSPNDETAIRRLHANLLESWGRKDARAFAASFNAQCLCVGFDGTQYESAQEVEEQLSAIFGHHEVASYVWIVRGVRGLDGNAALLHAVVGMVPPGKHEIKADRNAVQTLVACKSAGAWRIASFQNTPAIFDGRPEASAALTEELQRLVVKGRQVR